MTEGLADEDEARLRLDLALCTRLMAGEGILGYSGHVAARLPGGERILIQPFDENRAEVTPECLLVTDLEANVISAPDGAKPPDETVIHTEIMKARPDASAVLHFHPEIATLFTMVAGVELAPVRNHAARWGSGFPVHGDAAKITNTGQARALVQTLAAHNAALLRAHGAVLVAESLPALLCDAVHFQENAETMYRASMLGRVVPLTQTEMEGAEAHIERPRHAAKLWKFYLARAQEAGRLVGIDMAAN